MLSFGSESNELNAARYDARLKFALAAALEFRSTHAAAPLILRYTPLVMPSRIRLTYVIVFVVLICMGFNTAVAAFNHIERSRKTSLVWFLSTNYINRSNVSYPVRVSPYLMLRERSIEERDDVMYLASSYQLTQPILEDAALIKASRQGRYQYAKHQLCEELPVREKLQPGFSTVGIMERMFDHEGKLLYTVRVAPSVCSAA